MPVEPRVPRTDALLNVHAAVVITVRAMQPQIRYDILLIFRNFGSSKMPDHSGHVI